MDFVRYLQIAVLALIQGAAELLPVSSSAHVILAQRVMGMDPSQAPQVFLLVMLHTGTMFAVIVYFWPRWRRILTGKRCQVLFPPDWPTVMAPESGAKKVPDTFFRWHFVKMLVLATACTGVLGLGLKVFIEEVILVRLLAYPKGEIEELFKHLPLIAAALVAVGLFIVAAGSRETAAEGGSLSTGATLWIGLVQGLCLPFRGFSRSGATISTGLFCGVSRSLSEDFSFALAVVLTPPVQVYSLYKLLKDRAFSTTTFTDELVPGLVGMIFSFAAGLVALRFLSAVLEKGRWRYFGYYCLLAAAVVFSAHFFLPEPGH
jgi:undecaprenyl-diphosphatase